MKIVAPPGEAWRSWLPPSDKPSGRRPALPVQDTLELLAASLKELQGRQLDRFERAILESHSTGRESSEIERRFAALTLATVQPRSLPVDGTSASTQETVAIEKSLPPIKPAARRGNLEQETEHEQEIPRRRHYRR